MYLRYNMAAKYMPEADKAILNDPQFKKVVSYMTNYYFNRYRELLSSNGFEADDLRNIITVFGLTYWGHCKPEARDRKAFMLMMRYIGQKLRTMVRWVSRKFGADEVILVGFRTNDSMHKATNSIVAPDLDDEIEESHMLPDGDPYHRLLAEEAEQDEKTAAREESARRRESQALVSALRKKLASDPEKYREQLCHYATSKHVANDVRTRARRVCRQYGFDYVQWLKERAERLGTDINQYTF